MTYYEKIEKLLSENLTEKAFKLWKGIDSMIPNIWEKYSSSTLKYHKRADGTVPSIAEHTYEMLLAGFKIMSMFDIKSKTSQCDALLMSIAFHDSLKYGEKGDRKHTTGEHDRLAADMIASNRVTFHQIMSENDAHVLEENIRYHSGQWSTDAKGTEFSFTNLNPQAQFVHMLDMLSTKDCLKM